MSAPAILRHPGVPGRYSWLTVAALAFIALLLICTIAPELLAPYDPIELNMASRMLPPSIAHPFGTDEAGRDIFSRVIYGTRYSLGVALFVVASAAFFGIVYGVASGLAPSWADTILMRIVDVFMGFPLLIFALAITAVIGRGLDSVMVALSIMWWPSYARAVRAEVLRLREFPHVEAARAIGVGPITLMRRHILPFLAEQVNIRMSTDVSYALVAVSALSFLGLGAKSPTPEWGLLIRDARPYFGVAWWYLAFPGLVIMLCAGAFSLLGDALTGERRD